jgi:hypothetical protein
MSKKTVSVETTEVAVAQETKVARRGRPAVEGSARQARMAARAARLAAGGELKRGRPSNPNSARQMKIAKRQEILENGGELKRGRKATPKAEAVAA